jgi:hypothetical protein
VQIGWWRTLEGEMRATIVVNTWGERRNGCYLALADAVFGFQAMPVLLSRSYSCDMFICDLLLAVSCGFNRS